MKMAFVCVLALALLALPASAASVRSIENGIDVWITPGDGTSYIEFDQEPIPKGFFCSKSAAFTGRVALKGRPLTTGNPGELGGADTIVQRLDDAVFDAKGVASTRIQIRALQLESVSPIKTTCGDFHLRVTLSGTQPMTKMRIIKDDEANGHFVAPLKVRYKLSFFSTDVAQPKPLELVRGFTLAPAPNATWGAIKNRRADVRQSALVVDTDGDQVPDTYLPKTSGNFQAGWTPDWERLQQSRPVEKVTAIRDPYAYDCGLIVDPECHEEAVGVHCAVPCAYAY